MVELTTNRLERLDPGSRLYTATARRLTVASSRPHLGRWIVTFEEVTDRAGADQLHGAVLTADPVRDPDALWVHELVGSRVVDSSGRDHGPVVAVQANPASDLLVLEDGGLVPLRFVSGTRPGFIEVDIPDGLLE